MKDDDDDIQYSYADLRAAVLAEREACAELCEELRDEDGYECWGTECAVAIRAKDMYTKPQNVNTSAERVHESDNSIHEPWDTSDMAHRTGGLSMEQEANDWYEKALWGKKQEPELVGVIGNWGRVEWADGVYPQMGDRLYSAPSSKQEEK